MPARIRTSGVRKNIRRWFVLPLIASGALTLCIGVDMLYPTRTDFRAFDAHDVAALETRMWRSYYEHRAFALFSELPELLQREYGMPFWQSNLAAYHAAKAAVIFQRGHNRTEYLEHSRTSKGYIAWSSSAGGSTSMATELRLVKSSGGSYTANANATRQPISRMR
jgi:hypothetical protein